MRRPSHNRAHGLRTTFRPRLELLEDRCVPSASSLDSTFGIGGRVITNLGSGQEAITAIALQPDGKIVAAGYTTGANRDFVVVRYHSDGTLDPSFASDGVIIDDLSAGDDTAYAVAIQPDGKIVVAGASGGDFAVTRYNPDGSPDTAFFSAFHTAYIDFFGGDDWATGVAIQADCKIVVAGAAQGRSGHDFAVARLNSDGTLDSSFSANGKADVDFPNYDDGVANAVVIQPDGKIVLAGSSHFTGFVGNGGADMAVARLNANGTLDLDFSGDGKTTLSSPGANSDDLGFAAALQPDGKIVIAGAAAADFTASPYFFMGRLNANGSLNHLSYANFAGNSAIAYSVGVQTDGKIVAAGLSQGPKTIGGADFALASWNKDGSPDHSFSGNGKTTTDFSAHADGALAMAIQKDGRIVAAGVSHGDLALARYQGDPVLPNLNVAQVLGTLYVSSTGGRGVQISLSDNGRGSVTVAVPGRDSPSVTFVGIDQVKVDTGAGDDTIAVQFVPDTVEPCPCCGEASSPPPRAIHYLIRTGAGRDFVNIDWQTPDTPDFPVLLPVLDIFTEAGEDELTVAEPSGAFSDANGNTLTDIDLGTDNDRATINLTVLQTPDSPDRPVARFNVSGGAGYDSLAFVVVGNPNLAPAPLCTALDVTLDGERTLYQETNVSMEAWQTLNMRGGPGGTNAIILSDVSVVAELKVSQLGGPDTRNSITTLGNVVLLAQVTLSQMGGSNAMDLLSEIENNPKPNDYHFSGIQYTLGGTNRVKGNLQLGTGATAEIRQFAGDGGSNTLTQTDESIAGNLAVSQAVVNGTNELFWIDMLGIPGSVTMIDQVATGGTSSCNIQGGRMAGSADFRQGGDGAINGFVINWDDAGAVGLHQAGIINAIIIEVRVATGAVLVIDLQGPNSRLDLTGRIDGDARVRQIGTVGDDVTSAIFHIDADSSGTFDYFADLLEGNDTAMAGAYFFSPAGSVDGSGHGRLSFWSARLNGGPGYDRGSALTRNIDFEEFEEVS